MVFSSIIFIFYFLPVFLFGYYLSGWRTGALLLGSVLFYTWGEGPYVLLLGALILLNWAVALRIERAASDSRRRWITGILIAVDVGVLAVFKYTGFVAESLNQALSGAPVPVPDLALPLGISFFTFQLVSYAIDVARRDVPAERSLATFASYILMFPHLIAGPIVRYGHIRDELHADRRRTGRIGLGVQYFIVGLAQKVLVANTVASLADHAFKLPVETLPQATAWVGAIAYMLQIYFDFCGYSNMAIGLAFMLGFTFPKNFDYPYISRSITEFWRRWHISLSSWFRDYVYIPLGGNRRGQWRTVRNLLIVFLLTGLWHGAAWNFIAWGLFHGLFLLVERFGLARLLDAAPRAIGHAYALLVVLVGWVLFRAESLPHAIGYLGAMLDPSGQSSDAGLLVLLNGETVAALLAGVLFSAPLFPHLARKLGAPRLPASEAAEPRLDTQGVYVVSTALLIGGLTVSIAKLAGASLNPFLYFRF
jgi:alginate O-acetyltransferase complex protein AlgI